MRCSRQLGDLKASLVRVSPRALAPRLRLATCYLVPVFAFVRTARKSDVKKKKKEQDTRFFFKLFFGQKLRANPILTLLLYTAYIRRLSGFHIWLLPLFVTGLALSANSPQLLGDSSGIAGLRHKGVIWRVYLPSVTTRALFLTPSLFTII